MLPILSPSPYSWHRTAFIFRVYHCFVFFSFLNNFFSSFFGGFMTVGGKGVGCRGVSVGGDGTLLFELFSRRGGALSPCSRPTSVLHFWDITFLWNFFVNKNLSCSVWGPCQCSECYLFGIWEGWHRLESCSNLLSILATLLLQSFGAELCSYIGLLLFFATLHLQLFFWNLWII